MFKKPLRLLFGIVMLSAAAVTSSSLAWFYNLANIGPGGANLPIESSTVSGYFAYGDGTTKDTAYGIKTPRQLYNLAWLQYLGLINLDSQQLYFELADNIDMTGWILPPIGTETYPFIGYFDGQGYVVSNLTISNKFGDYNDHPSIISGFNSTDKLQPHILGMFGVVGDYNGDVDDYDSSINKLTNTGIYNATITTYTKDTLMGVAAGYVNAGDDNKGGMQNILVDGSSINIDESVTATTTSYGGFTDNISDYSLVGYTTKEAVVEKTEESVYAVNTVNNVFNATEDGNAQGWGGSINMKTIYYRIASLRKTKATNVSNTFNFRQDRYYYDNVEKTSELATYSGVSTTNGTRDAYSRYNGYNESGHNFVGNYNIYARSEADGYPEWSTRTTDQSFLYLSGGHYEKRTYRSSNTHTGYPITDGNGHYLTANVTSGTNNSNNAGTVSNSNSLATVWDVPTSGSGYISTKYCYNNGTERTYYLYVKTNHEIRLSTSTSYRTQFTYSKDSSSGKIRYITSDNYYLTYSNGNWIMQAIPTAPNPTTIDSYLSNGYQIFYDNHYMSRVDNTTVGYASNVSAAETYGWRFENSSNNNDVAIGSASSVRIYCMVAGSSTKYYVYNKASQNDYWKVGLTTTRSSAATFTVSSAGNDVYYFAYNSYHLVCDTSHSIYSIRTANDGNSLYRSLTVKLTSTIINDYLNAVSYPIAEMSSTSLTGPDYHQTTSDTTKSNNESHMYYTAEDTTYFPLNVEKDIDSYISNQTTMNTRIANNDLDPKDSNTGYIISGSSIANNATTLTHDTSRIRISEYPISNVNGSYNKTAGSTSTIADLADSKVYTINTSGTATNMGAVDTTSESSLYPRYSESKAAFYQNALTTSTVSNGTTTYKANTNVYGLHFMDSTISKNSIVDGSKVSVLGNKCDNYQLPVNSVDFNLKQKGIVNFFAGSYYDGNKAFFSLHEVLRNNDATQKTNGQGEPIEGQYSSFNTISDIKEIEEIWSTDQGTKTTKYANIYKYKGATGNAMYSVPYRVDGNQNKYVMNKNNTADSNVAYSYATMNSTDFSTFCSTYGYTLRFKTSQIGARSSLTDNSIYYFEFPMNPGEYCLGSVANADGAYLLYLDIGANAAKTQRTTFYEHIIITNLTDTYPAGVALVDLPETYTAGVATIDVATVVDCSNSACMSVAGGAIKGEYKMERTGDDVALTRAQSQNAPPVYEGFQITLLHDVGSTTPLVVSSEAHTYDIKRMQYYDFNVNLDSLTITTITDTSLDGGAYSRTIVQKVFGSSDPSSTPNFTYTYDSSLGKDERSSMKIYNTNGGVKYSIDDIIDTSVLTIGNSSLSTDLILKISISFNGVSYDNVIDLIAVVDLDNTDGTYYLFDNYLISITPVEGQVTIKVISIDTGYTIYVGTTKITAQNQTITINP